jgi:hypothetical protein
MKPEYQRLEAEIKSAMPSTEPTAWELRLNYWFLRARDRCAGLFPFLLRPGTIKTVAVETTTECTRKCVYCPPHHSLHIPPLRMDWGLYSKVLDSLAAHGFAGRMFFNLYGESLADDRLEDWVRGARAAIPTAELTVFTNGDLLTLNRYLTLKKSGVDTVVLSLHSNNPGDALLETLAKLRRDHPALYSVRVMNYHRLHHLEGNTLGLLNNKGGLADVKRKPFFHCFEAAITAIDCLGNVLLCCNDCTSSYVFGNIGKEDLYAIWNDPGFISIRRKVMRGQWPFEICRRCMSAEGLTTPRPAGASTRLPAAFHDFDEAMSSLGLSLEKRA